MPTLRVRVKPRSSRRAILECKQGVWQIALTSPPEGGKANKELLKLLGKALGVPPSSLVISSGEKSRDKTIEVGGVEDDAISRRLSVGMNPDAKKRKPA
jgi:hypothetical protein